jgi:hypothetical protein
LLETEAPTDNAGHGEHVQLLPQFLQLLSLQGFLYALSNYDAARWQAIDAPGIGRLGVKQDVIIRPENGHDNFGSPTLLDGGALPVSAGTTPNHKLDVAADGWSVTGL